MKHHKYTHKWYKPKDRKAIRQKRREMKLIDHTNKEEILEQITLTENLNVALNAQIELNQSRVVRLKELLMEVEDEDNKYKAESGEGR